MNFIDHLKELAESNYVISDLAQSGWMGKDVIIVNCSPEYSSRLTQLLNHKTSYLNKNELYEQVSLYMPTENMNQVWDFEEKDYVTFDRYLMGWMKRNFHQGNKYLFVTNTIFTGKHLNKVRLLMKGKTENENFRFLCLNSCNDTILRPDFTYRWFDKENPPVFFWENKNPPTKVKTSEKY